MQNTLDKKLAIIGLGYVGLPLAAAFGAIRPTIGFDKNPQRVHDLTKGLDVTRETEQSELKEAIFLSFTHDLAAIKDCDIYIVTVPTPITKFYEPDLEPLKNAMKQIGNILQKGNIVIIESTVYPGVTEEVCVPILEEISKLKFNADFYCGYSPERINPGDKKHRLPNIKKITSGSTKEIAIEIDELYKQIIKAGTFLAKSIKVAEAAKVIENTQRDVNIALINELSIIFNKLDIDTTSVLEAAETKWNFLPFKPGLVGGHCIGIDPYYLLHKSLEVGYSPEIITAGRKINDGMSKFIASEVLELLKRNDVSLKKANALILGFTFKENCPDVRNTKVFDLILELQKEGVNVDVFDPVASFEDSLNEYSIKLIHEPKINFYDLIILAVAHNEFNTLNNKTIKNFGKENVVIYDIKNFLEHSLTHARL